MATEILLPQWGMEMLDGTIVKWLKREGDPVEEGEPIVEVETAKIETELESTASGILVHIMVAEGTNVPVRSLLAIVADPGEDVPRPGTATPSGQGVAAAPIQDYPLTSSPPQDGDRVPVVPAARRLAQGLANIEGISVDPDTIHTNIVIFEVDQSVGTANQVIDALAEEGVLVTYPGKQSLRMVTHRHIGGADIDDALGRVSSVVRQLKGQTG